VGHHRKVTGADRAIEDLTATVNSIGLAWADRDAAKSQREQHTYWRLPTS